MATSPKIPPTEHDDSGPELTDEQLQEMAPLVAILADWMAYFADEECTKAA